MINDFSPLTSVKNRTEAEELGQVRNTRRQVLHEEQQAVFLLVSHLDDIGKEIK